MADTIRYEIGQLVLIKGRGSWVIYQGAPMLIPAMGHVQGYWWNSDEWGYTIDGEQVDHRLVTLDKDECIPKHAATVPPADAE